MIKKSTKNILICIPSYTHGGAEIHSLYTAKALQEVEGVKVFFLAFGRVDTFQDKLKDEGFAVIRLTQISIYISWEESVVMEQANINREKRKQRNRQKELDSLEEKRNKDLLRSLVSYD